MPDTGPDLEESLDQLLHYTNGFQTIYQLYQTEWVAGRRNREALKLFTTTLLPHAAALTGQARTALAQLPPARHHEGWRLLLDDLDHATEHVEDTLALPAPAGIGEIMARRASSWPCLASWAEHAPLVRHLAEQTSVSVSVPSLSAPARERWTALARQARADGDLVPFESWYDARGRLITLAHLTGTHTEPHPAPVLALAGDLDSDDMAVLGCYDSDHTASADAPRPVPSGVLRPDRSRYDEPVDEPETFVQDLINGVVRAVHTGEAAQALLVATRPSGPDRGVLPRLVELISTSAEFAEALETQQGRRTAARLTVLARRLTSLTDELRFTSNELDKLAAVLPAHRTPRPRHTTTVTPPPARDTHAPSPAPPLPATTPAPRTR